MQDQAITAGSAAVSGAGSSPPPEHRVARGAAGAGGASCAAVIPLAVLVHALEREFDAYADPPSAAAAAGTGSRPREQRGTSTAANPSYRGTASAAPRTTRVCARPLRCPRCVPILPLRRCPAATLRLTPRVSPRV